MAEEEGRPRRRLAAVLFCDMVGYTRLMDEDEAVALRLVDELRRIAADAVSEHAGEVVKTMGDGIFAAFESAVEAVRAALTIQRGLAARNTGEGAHEPLLVRIGIHLGDLLQEGDDLMGSGVNVASRLEPLAPPEGVVISGEIHQQVRNQSDLSFRDLGEQRLRNIEEPIRVYAVESAVEPQPAAAGPPAIAVLPFQNMSPDPENEYFSDGVTEEIIMRLSKIHQLRVVSRSATFQYKGKSVDPREAGRTLRADSVLEGSVRKHGNRLRITAQLINAGDGYHLWSDQYDREEEDVFGIQSEIAERVAESLRVELMAGERRQIRSQATESVEAYDLYLKGRHFWNKRGEADLKVAIGFFEKASEVDPTFALAYAGLADAYVVLPGYTRAANPRDYREKARVAAQRALELDDTLAEAHTSLAMVKLHHDWDWEGAEEGFKRAIALNPNYATAYHWYSAHLGTVGRPGEALASARRAQELDPVSAIIGYEVAWRLMTLRQFDEAVRELKNTLEIHPESDFVHLMLGRAYLTQGKFEDGIKHIQRAIFFSKSRDRILPDLAVGYALAGRTEEAERTLERVMAQSPTVYVSPMDVAYVYLALDDKDQAFEWMERAFEERDSYLPAVIKSDPLLVDRLGDDPRYLDLLSRLDLAD
ncbi:MAG: adenylate/guanylate cyclase domain-containing protein [Anaerolineae bacterium]